MKILLLRIGRLGDMVMILPALREIRRLYPQASLYAVTSADGLRLLKAAGLASDNLMLYRNSLIYRLFDALKVKRFIRYGQFDHIFCFEAKKRTASWLPKQASRIYPQQQLEHYALRCLKLVNPLPQQLHQQDYLTYDRTRMQILHEQLKQYHITANTLLIGFHPTYSGFQRRKRHKEHGHRMWPWPYFAELARKLVDYGYSQGIDLRIIMDVLPEEREIGLNIQQACDHKIILLANKPDFQRYLCYLKRLNLLIVANTGVMHLAAALNTPVLALFSLLHPGDCGPYMPNERFEVLRAEDSDNPALGLAALTVEQVFTSALQLLRKSQN